MMARGEDLVAACEILSAGERKELEEAVNWPHSLFNKFVLTTTIHRKR